MLLKDSWLLARNQTKHGWKIQTVERLSWFQVSCKVLVFIHSFFVLLRWLSYQFHELSLLIFWLVSLSSFSPIITWWAISFFFMFLRWIIFWIFRFASDWNFWIALNFSSFIIFSFFPITFSCFLLILIVSFFLSICFSAIINIYPYLISFFSLLIVISVFFFLFII